MELGRAVGAEGLVAGQVVDIQSEDKEVGLDVLKVGPAASAMGRARARLELQLCCCAVDGKCCGASVRWQVPKAIG